MRASRPLWRAAGPAKLVSTFASMTLRAGRTSSCASVNSQGCTSARSAASAAPGSGTNCDDEACIRDAAARRTASHGAAAASSHRTRFMRARARARVCARVTLKSKIKMYDSKRKTKSYITTSKQKTKIYITSKTNNTICGQWTWARLCWTNSRLCSRFCSDSYHRCT